MFYTKINIALLLIFIFQFEYKWGNTKFNNFYQFQYDAGCYNNVYDDKIWPSGIEYQVRYDHTKNRNPTGDYWATNIQCYSAKSITFSIPCEGGLEMPKKGGEHRALKDAEFDSLNDEWKNFETAEIYYRNIMIKEFYENIPIEEFLK